MAAGILMRRLRSPNQCGYSWTVRKLIMATGHSSSQHIFAALGFMGRFHINNYLDSTAAFKAGNILPRLGLML